MLDRHHQRYYYNLNWVTTLDQPLSSICHTDDFVAVELNQNRKSLQFVAFNQYIWFELVRLRKRDCFVHTTIVANISVWIAVQRAKAFHRIEIAIRPTDWMPSYLCRWHIMASTRVINEHKKRKITMQKQAVLQICNIETQHARSFLRNRQ